MPSKKVKHPRTLKSVDVPEDDPINDPQKQVHNPIVNPIENNQGTEAVMETNPNDQEAVSEINPDDQQVDQTTDFVEDDEPPYRKANSDESRPASVETLRQEIQWHLNSGILPKEIRAVVNEELKGLKSNVSGTKVFKLSATNFDDFKMAPQKLGILRCLQDNGGEMSQSDLIMSLPGYVKTQQSPEKIVTHYRKQLIDEDWVDVVEEE